MSTVRLQATPETAETHQNPRPDRKLRPSRGRPLTPARGGLELAVALVLASFLIGFGWVL